MPSARVRNIILKQLYNDFKEAGITHPPTYEEYFGKSKKPVLFRVIKKNFNNWIRTLASLERYYPDVYKKPVVQPKPVVKPAEVKDSISIAEKLSMAAKPAKPKAAEKKDGKNI